METTKLSSKGQVVIPRSIRASRHWGVGQELIVIEAGDGILLKPKAAFEETQLDNVASCLKYRGKAKSIVEIEQAISEGIKKKYK